MCTIRVAEIHFCSTEQGDPSFATLAKELAVLQEQGLIYRQDLPVHDFDTARCWVCDNPNIDLDALYESIMGGTGWTIKSTLEDGIEYPDELEGDDWSIHALAPEDIEAYRYIVIMDIDLDTPENYYK